MLTLAALKSIRIGKGLNRVQLSALSNIDTGRLKDLELRDAEPWFDEAMILHRTLNTGGVAALISTGDLSLSDAGIPLPNDIALWQAGGRAPLSLAVRVAARLGLADPAELSISPLVRQLWAVLAATERHPEAPGWCAWCRADIVAGDPHAATCLAHNLLSREPDRDDVLRPPALRPASRREQGTGVTAHGLKGLRTARELVQRQVADMLGLHPNHYARIERAEVPLTHVHAMRLAAAWGCEVAELYAKPEESADG